jgi:hypothetical protein
MPLRQHLRASIFLVGSSLSFGLGLLPGYPFAAVAQSPQSTIAQDAGRAAESGSQQPTIKGTGSIDGTVVDQNGALAVGAQVRITRPGQLGSQQVQSGDNGQFSFANQPAGPFQLTITAIGFQSKTVSGTLQTGQAYIVPEIAIKIASTTTDVKVGVDTEEVAEVQIKEQEKQRVLGFIPNFYASYVPNAAPLSSKLKYQLAFRSVTDPISILGAGFLAGIYQASDQFSGYGQGAAGYGKRFGATYADQVIGTFVDSAVLPSLFHQDPRYFYKGTGTKKSRLVYALENAVICRSDNGQREVNYSAIIGSFATSGISYLYYPASDRGGEVLVQTALVGIAEGGVAAVFQEFVVRKLTPHLKNHQPVTDVGP